jgi:uncharacterized protein (DUF2147 family)
MHKHLASAAHYAGLIIRSLPLADIDFGRLERLVPVVLYQAEQRAHLTTHALGWVLMGAYAILMAWLIAASLATLRFRNVVRSGIPATLVAALYLASAPYAQAGDDPGGVWLTQAGDARVRVSRCGSGLCGTVVWLKDQIDPATGKPFTDNKNPDPLLAKRLMIGLPIFLDMKPAGLGRWSGHIYNADDGKAYVSNVVLTGPLTLKVEGCIGSLCGSETWTRSH